MIEHLQICDLNFEVRRSSRRTTLGLTLDRGGELIIHAPSGSAVEELGQWAQSKLLWVYRKLAIQEAMKPQVNLPEYVTGERFAYLGRTYRLMIVKDQDEALLFNGASFTLRQDARSEGHVHFRQWYISQGTEWVKDRIKQLTPKIGILPTHI
jgi:predicted metal-dependent hydrolase